MSKPHKWHKEIKAWADGAKIESYAGKCDDIWDAAPYPNWNNDNLKFRIKPQSKEPQYLYVYQNNSDEYRFSDLMVDNFNLFKYIGKIKLEVDDV